MDKLLDIAPCGYLSFKDDGVICLANQTLSDWLGFSRGELEGRNIEHIFPVSTKIFYNTHFFPIVKLHSRAEEIFLMLSTKDKRSIPVLANAERRMENGVHTIHCVFIQVQQRRKYEDEILQAKKNAENAIKENKHFQELMRSLENRTLELDRQNQQLLNMNTNLLQFGKIVSHDLQEPLRKIQLFLDIIERQSKDILPDKSRSAIQKINASAERLKSLTMGLQQYITVNAEKTFAEVDLDLIVENAKSKAIDHRGFSDFDLHHDKLPVIQGYFAQMELLFFHLVDNSIQFREPSRKLRIDISGVLVDENVYRLTSEKYQFTEHIKIRFSDNGAGFDPQYEEYVFELLKKIEPGTTGLGMGLPLVKKIVENHSGTLTMQTMQGIGTTFTILLPVRLDHKAA